MQGCKEHFSYLIKYVAAAAVIWLACPELAHAGMRDSVNSVVGSLKDFPTILSGCAYLYGAGTVLEGANRLKKYSEDPTKGGAWGAMARIGIGGSFAALPVMIGWVNNSLSIGDGKLNFERLNRITSLIDPNFTA